MSFSDRKTAGKALIPLLEKYGNNKNTVILALPRGGVVVAEPIAKSLHVDLDVLIVRKVGAPYNEEYAIGAIAEPDEFIKNEAGEYAYDFDAPEIKEIIEKEKTELKRRSEKYRCGKKRISLNDKIVILTDDGLATGTTMQVAIQAVKKEKPQKIIIAVPVAPPDTAQRLCQLVDECIILEKPPLFTAVGQFYENFEQTTDEEVTEIMKNFSCWFF